MPIYAPPATTPASFQAPLQSNLPPQIPGIAKSTSGLHLSDASVGMPIPTLSQPPPNFILTKPHAFDIPTTPTVMPMSRLDVPVFSPIEPSHGRNLHDGNRDGIAAANSAGQTSVRDGIMDSESMPQRIPTIGSGGSSSMKTTPTTPNEVFKSPLPTESSSKSSAGGNEESEAFRLSEDEEKQEFDYENISDDEFEFFDDETAVSF